MVTTEFIGIGRPISNENAPGVLPELEKTPAGKLDAVVILGMGPVMPFLVGTQDQRHVTAATRLRLEAIAAAELVSKYVKSDGLIIASGKPTGKSETANEGYKTRTKIEGVDEVGKLPVDQIADLYWQAPIVAGTSGLIDSTLVTAAEGKKLPLQQYLQLPVSQAEISSVLQTAEADLITDLLLKSSAPDQRQQLEDRIFGGRKSHNTIANIIEALNYLDKKTGKMWKGKLGILSLNYGQLQRALMNLDIFGMGDSVVPLSGEAILEHAQYDQKYLSYFAPENVPLGDIQEQHKLLRSLREIPAFLVPEIVAIENDERLLRVVANMKKFYGADGLAPFHLERFDEEHLSAEEIRNRIRNVSNERVRFVYEIAKEYGTLKELEIDGLDPDNDFADLRALIADGVIGGKDDTKAIKQAEIVRRLVKQKYGNDSAILAQMGLSNIDNMEWYEIKVWFYGRSLAPAKWGKQANEPAWRKSLVKMRELTLGWLKREKPSHAPIRVILVRHGEAEGNKQDTVMGQSSQPNLTEVGRQEAKNLGRQLRDIHFDYVITSPTRRAGLTARKIIAAQAVRDRVERNVDLALNERDFGPYTNQPSEVVRPLFAQVDALPVGERMDARLASGVETDRNMADRMFHSLQRMVRGDKHQNILVVTHGGSVSALLVRLLGEERTRDLSRGALQTGGYIELIYENGEYQIGNSFRFEGNIQ